MTMRLQSMVPTYNLSNACFALCISVHGLWFQCAVDKSAKEGIINHS